MDRVRELEIFITVAERGSFAAAARMLRVSAPTVTRAVADLEARVGVRLFDRGARRCRTTEAGRQLADDARHVLGAYGEAIAAASGAAAAPRGLVRITAPIAFGREHVAPAVAMLVDRQAALSIELDLSDRQADLHDGGFDLAVRIGAVRDGALIGRRLGSVRRMIVASPAYLAERGVPETPADLADHDIVHHGSDASLPWQFRDRDGRTIVQPVRSRLAINQADAAIAAALAGRGLVSVLSYQVFDAVADGRLATVLDAWREAELPVRLLWIEGRQRLARVRLAIDHLTEVLSALPALRAG